MCVWMYRFIWVTLLDDKMQLTAWKPDKWSNPERDWKHYNSYEPVSTLIWHLCIQQCFRQSYMELINIWFGSFFFLNIFLVSWNSIRSQGNYLQSSGIYRKLKECKNPSPSSLKKVTSSRSYWYLQKMRLCSDWLGCRCKKVTVKIKWK